MCIVHKFCQNNTNQSHYTMPNDICHCLISSRRRIFTVIGVLLSVIIISGVENDVVNGFSPTSTRPLTTTRTANNNKKKITIGSSFLSSSLKANNLVPIDDSNYRELFRGEKFLLLDVFAPWCGPCKLIEPLLEKFANEWKDSLVIGKFNVDDVKNNSKDLKVELVVNGVMPQALPALILVHKDKIITTWKGVIHSNELQCLLEEHVSGITVDSTATDNIANRAPFRGINFSSLD